MIAARDDAAHELMPGRMKLERIDALATYVERMQERRVAIRGARGFEGLGRPERDAGGREFGRRRAGPLARRRFAQCRVARPQVIVDERRGLVEDGVRRRGLHI